MEGAVVMGKEFLSLYANQGVGKLYSQWLAQRQAIINGQSTLMLGKDYAMLDKKSYERLIEDSQRLKEILAEHPEIPRRKIVPEKLYTGSD